MKSTFRLLLLATFTSILIAPLQAALIFNGSYNNANSNMFIGTYNGATIDSGLWSNGTLGLGAFTSTWLFNAGPLTTLTANANFVPGFPNPNAIQSFQISIYSASASGGCTANTLSTGGLCTGVSLGSLLRTGINSGNSSNIGFFAVDPGLYAIIVTGTVVSTPVLYSGQLTTTLTVPEPASFALVGLALAGICARFRKR